MFYWNPEKPETQFFFNDRDPVDGRVFTVLYDINERQRIKEYRSNDHSLGNSGVSPSGGYFAAINYGRMARLRPVTGYAGALDPTANDKAPANDGVFLVDIKTGEVKLLVSFSALSEFLRAHPHWKQASKRWMPVEESIEPQPEISEAELYINHTLVSRDGETIYFFVRGRMGKHSIWLNAPCSIKQDGTGLTLHTTSIGGHPEWTADGHMIGSHDGRQVVYDVQGRQLIPERTLGDETIFPDPEGDVSLSPDGEWFVNGYASEDRESIYYSILRLADGAHDRVGPFNRGPYTKGNLRTDPAPRWNRESNAILVPGWTHDGTRQLFIIKIIEPLSME
jgi:hypothetical protein